MKPSTYWLTRVVFIRCLAFIYGVAFTVSLLQNKHLIGRNGLLPAHLFFKQLHNHVGSDADIWKKLSTAPTLFWFVDLLNIDFYLDVVAYCGLAISFVVMITGAANMLAMATLWVLYHSIVNIGQQWYSFGWESQLLETGFLAIWMCPVLTWTQLPYQTPTPMVVIYGYRWLIFRIMLGAGLIKIRGDQCWRDLTCMNFHYETQPNPNPLAYYMHQSPEIMHKLEVASNHFIELVAPFLLLVPIRRCIIFGGVIQIFFMAMIVVSGNLSFLNHLTMLPSICCFDDKFLSMFFNSNTKTKVEKLQNSNEKYKAGYYIKQAFNAALLFLIAYLSIPVVQNLISSRQMMNTSFEPLRIVNTYGAFGSITKERTEVIMQGTHSSDPTDKTSVWLEYEFKCKPGNVSRIPCLISPYHYRLDWLMWFAAFQNYQHNPWLVHLVAKMLHNDKLISELISHNPFLDQQPPKYIRLEHYKYKFTKIGSDKAKLGHWWSRRRIGVYLPPVSLASLSSVLKKFEWID